MRRGIACVAMLASGCMAPSVAQQAGEPVRDRLQVSVAAAKNQTIERVLAAFVQENLTVASSAGGVITSEPLVLKSIGIEVSNITYTATVIGVSDTASQVVIAAYEQDLSSQGLAGHADADARRKPITSHYRAMYIPYWQRVERLARALEGR